MLSIHNAIEDAKTAWYEKNDHKTIAKKVQKRLDTQAEQAFMQLLGFSKDSWGHSVWEVDHCNGRSGQSDVGISSTAIVKDVLDKWLKANRDEFEKFLTLKIKTQFKKELNNQLYYHVNKAVKELLDRYMESTSMKLLDAELKDLTYEAAMKLIQNDLERN